MQKRLCARFARYHLYTDFIIGRQRHLWETVIKITTFWHTTVGKKIVMAVTGVVMLLFLAIHAAGNLLIFRGPAELDAYTAFLKQDAILLWLVRIVLLSAIALHGIAAYQLAKIDRAARTTHYTRLKPQSATLASRTMRANGVLIAVFVIFHLLHLTTGTIKPSSFVTANVYSNVVSGFHVWWVSAIYLVTLIAIGLHLYHGAWSWLRTVGLSRPNAAPLHRPIATAIAVFVWAAFTSIPLAVLAGILE